MGYRTPPRRLELVSSDRHTVPADEVTLDSYGCTYYELAGSGPASVEAWEVAAARSRHRSAERHAHNYRARYWQAIAAVYGVILAGAVILADAGGLPGLL